MGVYHICKLFSCGWCKLYHSLDNWSMAADGNYVNTKMTRDDLWSKKVHNGGRNIFSSVVIKHSSCRQNRRIQWPLLYNSLSQISSYFVLPCSSKSAYKVDFNGPVVGTWQLLKCISLDGWDFPSSSQFVSEGFNRCDNLKL